MDIKKVLIVDDDRIIREQLEKTLKKMFLDTFTASTGEQALEIFKSNSIDIVVLDVKLPDMDGLEVLNSIKSINVNSEVIIITGFGNEDVAIQALRRGAIDYIEKPLNIEDLSAAIGRAKENLIQKKDLIFKNTVLVIDDDPTIVTWLEKILKKENYDVFKAMSGAEALKIIENNKVDVIVTDINLDDTDGINIFRKAKNIYADIEGIVITGSSDHELSVKSLRAGLFDYIVKPINIDELFFALEKAIERINLSRSNLFRNRELKISKEIITKINEELERRIIERSRELSQTQAQLFQTSKLATLGEMSAGLAHEINQPLAGISLISRNFRKMMQRDMLTNEEINSGLDDIEGAVKRMSKIIQHIRTFARQDTLKFIDVNVNETIHNALSLLGEQLRLHQIEIVLELDENLPIILAEPYQLEQVWINLISNAKDALEEKIKNIKYNKKLIIKSQVDALKENIEMVFEDNGIGVDDEVKNKILEPFFTTKEVGKATGLGLSISFGIIESHKGKIIIDSKINEGTNIKISLPIKSNSEA